MIFQEMLKEERAEGRAEGRTEELLRQVGRKLEKNKTIEQIAEELELRKNEVEEFVQLLQNK